MTRGTVFTLFRQLIAYEYMYKGLSREIYARELRIFCTSSVLRTCLGIVIIINLFVENVLVINET